MKIFLINFIIFLIVSGCLNAQSGFDLHFDEGSMRVDLVFAGDTQSQSVYLLNVKHEPHWGGSRHNLIDQMNLGDYRFHIIDKNRQDTLYSRGFSTLFEEWRTTPEALSVAKAFHQTVTFPYPKNCFIFSLEARNQQGVFEPCFTTEMHPNNKNIQKEHSSDMGVQRIIHNGSPDQNLDLVFIAEGYKSSQMQKFEQDVHRLATYLLKQTPFDEFQERINVWAVCSPSEEEGTDIPGKKKWVNTAVNSSFNTFNIDRYLETEDVINIRNYAACAPYDHIIVLVNSNRYGGGGIYNHFSIVTADHAISEKVFVHELGHGLAGLADEYYTSDVAYENFFNLAVEPWQPNLTTLVDFEKKWKNQLPADLPIPTPDQSKYQDQIGVFEGGGYVKKGIYRSAINCRMKSNEAEGFCPVCQEAIRRTITFITD